MSWALAIAFRDRVESDLYTALSSDRCNVVVAYQNLKFSFKARTKRFAHSDSYFMEFTTTRGFSRDGPNVAQLTEDYV